MTIVQRHAADLGWRRGQRFRRGRHFGAGGQDQGAVGVGGGEPGGSQQVLGLGDVVRVVARQIREGEVRDGAEGTVGHRRLALKDGVDDGRPVGGIQQRLAHGLVVGREAPRVQHELERLSGNGDRIEAQVRVARHELGVDGLDLAHHLGLAAFQGQDAGGRVLVEAEDDALDGVFRLDVEARPPGVIRPALDDQPVAGDVLHHAIRPGADLMELVSRGIVGGQGGGTGDPQVDLAERVQQSGIRLGEIEPDGIGVHHRVTGQRAEHEARLLRAIGGVGDAIQVGDHGLGIEWRAVLKVHVVAQREGVGQPIVADLPGGRQTGDDFAGGRVAVNQGIVDRTQRESPAPRRR